MKNIDELRAKKALLKYRVDEGFENPLKKPMMLLKHYTSGDQRLISLKDKTNGRNQLMDEGVKALLTLVASTSVTRFNLGSVPKLLLSSTVAFATPYLVDKVQDAINKSQHKSKLRKLPLDRKVKIVKD